MILEWIKYPDGSWASLPNLNLADRHFDSLEGIYIIWQANGPIVRVGQGVIKDRLFQHRSDVDINRYDDLYVSWAKVEEQYRNGVEKYLADTLSPRVGEAFPDVGSIAVNLPWLWNTN